MQKGKGPEHCSAIMVVLGIEPGITEPQAKKKKKKICINMTIGPALNYSIKIKSLIFTISEKGSLEGLGSGTPG